MAFELQNLSAMLKNSLYILLILISFLSIGFAEDVNLLSIPLDDGTNFDYNIDVKQKCSFDGDTDITYPSFEEARKTNVILDKLSYFQKKLNLEIERQEITPKRITFSL